MDALPNHLPPVSDDAPAGPDLREDYSPQSLYYRLRDARAEARAAERQADSRSANSEENEPRRKDEPLLSERWRMVRDLAAQALSGTRDLEIGAWNVEALLRCDELRGFAAGVDLLAAMAGEFWDTVHPLPDSDGIEARVASITGLNGQGGDGTLLQPLRKLTLFERSDGTRVALWQYEQSKKGEGLPFDALETEAQAAGSARFAVLRDEAAAALAAWERLAATLDAKAGNDGPPTGRVRAVLEQLHETAAAYAGPATPASAPITASGPEAVAPGLAEPGGQSSWAVEPSAAASPGAPPRTREDALRALEDIATFFLRTEPLSPLSYTLQDAVRRGRMTWPELLAEIVPDWTTRVTILTSLGIKPPDSE